MRLTMKIELFHASKYGNGLTIAFEYQKQMIEKGDELNIHDIKEIHSNELPEADLYVLISPTHFGKPIRGIRNFIKHMDLPSGSRYAVISTEMKAKPGKKPDQKCVEKWQRTIPIINESLQAKGLVKVTDMTFYVLTAKGPLEDGWQEKLKVFIDATNETTS
jgi:menaquinone-dependent protoporphyrinogen IX oxidase